MLQRCVDCAHATNNVFHLAAFIPGVLLVITTFFRYVTTITVLRNETNSFHFFFLSSSWVLLMFRLIAILELLLNQFYTRIYDFVVQISQILLSNERGISTQYRFVMDGWMDGSEVR